MKTYITNERFSTMLTQLCSQIVPVRDKFEWIVGIERGGLPISNWLAYTLGKKHTSIRVSIYGDDEVPHDPPIVDLSNLPKTTFLLVDDIVDSGTTVRVVELEGGIRQGEHFYLATLHWCPDNAILCKPDFYVEEKKKGDWIVYPWEA